ncbi:MAG: 2-C-methyl-D-erythritol 2,4-cyclodiphosphate synthase [Candidatus Eremiobacteraeota bacterium]|nr:2-C-methyl-D-erythritol 2,4-cyclodiphosphate synthase [Candidatus Eremiobacteraeota bacterium]
MTRAGLGFDAHRLVAGRPLILAGCRIEFAKGLEGFSDGDVVAHAIIDALLGAAGLGDCGTHFPACDPRYANADSMQLLRTAVALLSESGFGIGNIDCTIVAEQPPLAPFVEAMRQNIAAATRLRLDRCSVKAKRTEGLGFTGDGSGMAAYAAASIEEHHDTA